MKSEKSKLYPIGSLFKCKKLIKNANFLGGFNMCL